MKSEGIQPDRRSRESLHAPRCLDCECSQPHDELRPCGAVDAMMWAALHGLDFLAGLDHSRDRVGLLVVTVGELIARGTDAPKAVLERAVVELRDALLEHVAKEEEGLFPYVVTYAPGLAKSVARLSSSHEALSAAVLRLEQSVHRKSSARRPDTPSTAFDRFHAIYAEHEATETRFLRRVDARLDDSQRHALAAIVRGL